MSLAAEKLRALVIEELTRIGGTIKRDEIIIKCPFHPDTRPSLGVHIGHKVFPGVFHCWSCGASGGWNKLANKLGLQIVNYGTISKVAEEDDVFGILSKGLQNHLSTQGKEIPVCKGLEELPFSEYRGLPKSYYDSINASYFWDRKTGIEYIHLPLTIHRQYIGYTLINMPRIGLKYLTFGNVSKALLLYDHIRSNHGIVLTEGHYDAMRLHYYNIPAVAVFGVENWSSYKTALLLSKLPKKIYILYDSDEAGKRAAWELYKELSPGFDVEILLLPAGDSKLDPGNMPYEYILELKNKLECECQ